MKISNKTTTRNLWEIGDEVLELPIGILQDDTGQVVGNERTHNNNIRQQQHNNQAKERS